MVRFASLALYQSHRHMYFNSNVSVDYAFIYLLMMCFCCDIVEAVIVFDYTNLSLSSRARYPFSVFDMEKMSQCHLCKVMFADTSVALTHNCHLLRTSNGNNLGNCWWSKITFQIERDKKERAAFVFQMHTNYMLFLTKHVVPCKGHEPRGC